MWGTPHQNFSWPVACYRAVFLCRLWVPGLPILEGAGPVPEEPVPRVGGSFCFSEAAMWQHQGSQGLGLHPGATLWGAGFVGPGSWRSRALSPLGTGLERRPRAHEEAHSALGSVGGSEPRRVQGKCGCSELWGDRYRQDRLWGDHSRNLCSLPIPHVHQVRERT